ncbi:MAG: hypothetical protein V2G40_01275 [bacterium JZ-2024 1]
MHIPVIQLHANGSSETNSYEIPLKGLLNEPQIIKTIEKMEDFRYFPEYLLHAFWFEPNWRIPNQKYLVLIGIWGEDKKVSKQMLYEQVLWLFKYDEMQDKFIFVDKTEELLFGIPMLHPQIYQLPPRESDIEGWNLVIAATGIYGNGPEKTFLYAIRDDKLRNLLEEVLDKNWSPLTERMLNGIEIFTLQGCMNCLLLPYGWIIESSHSGLDYGCTLAVYEPHLDRFRVAYSNRKKVGECRACIPEGIPPDPEKECLRKYGEEVSKE